MSTEPASTASEPKAEAPPSAPEPSHASTASEPPAKPSPVDAFLDRLPAVLAEADYNECWGVSLNPDGENDGPTRMVLHKWLNSAQGDLELAVKNLTASLKWRKEFRPLDCVDEMHDAKFDGLGYITRNHIDGQLAVVTWNVYAAAKSHAEVFGDLNAFLRWRVGLMERALQEFNLQEAQDFQDKDPYQTYQIHDYLSVSFLRMDPAAKTASKETIKLFSTHYCELLCRKFFVNVPYIMSWMFAASKMLLPAKTTAKFMMLSDGSYLAGELATDDLPKAYGGNKEERLHDKAIVLKSKSKA